MQATDTSPWRLDLVLLGIGGAFDADQGVANTGALLECFDAQDQVTHRILIDCGHTCGRQLHALGLTYKDIDAILITHAHGDHIDGLEVAGYKGRFAFQRRLTLRSPEVVLERIWSSLSPKMGRLQLDSDTSVDADLSTYFDPHPAPVNTSIPLIEGRLEARFIRVPHVHGMPAFGILLDIPGGPHIRWSGDTIYDADSALFNDLQAERGDRLFHDCIFYPYYSATVHTHFEQLQALPEATRQRTVLVHHGRVEEAPEPLDRMVLGQPLQRFTLYTG